MQTIAKHDFLEFNVPSTGIVVARLLAFGCASASEADDQRGCCCSLLLQLIKTTKRAAEQRAIEGSRGDQ